MNRSDTISKIATAIVKAQGEMGNAVKGSANPFYKSKFADLNSVREACIPPLNAQGVSVLQPTSVIDGKLYVETLLLHESGEFISGLYEVVVAKQNDPQALGAAISYSRRYGLQSMVNIGAEDDDAESAMGRNVKVAPAKPTLAVATNFDTSKIDTKAEAVAQEVAVAKKGGFGVKAKVETTTTGSEEGWN